jgi:hypothetical protein
MKDFFVGATVMAGACLIGWGLCFPLQHGLNYIAVKTCEHSSDRGLMTYRDTIFPGQVKVACVERKYL